jgi:hypothetical protein
MDSAVMIVTKLGSNPGRDKKFVCFLKRLLRLWNPHHLPFKACRSSLPAAQGVNLNIYLRLLSRLRVSGAAPLLFPYAFIVWKGRTLYFTFTCVIWVI